MAIGECSAYRWSVGLCLQLGLVDGLAVTITRSVTTQRQLRLCE